MGLSRRFTFTADWVGQHFFDAPQVSTPRNVTVTVNSQEAVFSTIVPLNGGYNVNNFAVGVKANPWRNLLVLGNLTIKLDDGGLRAPVVPLVGVSYPSEGCALLLRPSGEYNSFSPLSPIRVIFYISAQPQISNVSKRT